MLRAECEQGSIVTLDDDPVRQSLYMALPFLTPLAADSRRRGGLRGVFFPAKDGLGLPKNDKMTIVNCRSFVSLFCYPAARSRVQLFPAGYLLPFASLGPSCMEGAA